MAFVRLGPTDVHYLRAGSGPPLVFIHGFGGCAECWYQQIDAFSADFEVIAYDSVNHGHSSNSPAGQSEPDRADELEAFLAALGIDNPILAGNSMGALTILRWASRHPDAAAALVPSGMGVAPPGQDPQAGAARLRAMAGPVADDVVFLPAETAFTPEFPARNPEKYERYVRLRSTATRIEAARRPRTAPAADPSREELVGRVGSIRSPMQIVVGDRDWLYEAALHLHRLVPGPALQVLPGAPHNA